MYCKKCGGKLESYASNCAFCGAPVDNYDDKAKYVEQRSNSSIDKPMTMWKWIGFYLLNVIPVVGQIIVLVLLFKWASKKNPDKSLQGFAKANLFLILIAIVITVLFSVLIAVGVINQDFMKDYLESLSSLK